MSAPSIAIIGSGPSGCYMAQALRRHWAESEIAIFDRLPVPYGLVRYGVAPDHPGTKAVTRQFERMFEREHIHFVGNAEIGKTISLEALRAAFDIVVVATGLHGDRPLGVEGDDAVRVYGAGRVTRLLNDHPDEIGFKPSFGKRPVIVGNGNVAIDVLRLLAKSATDFHGSEVSEESLAQLAAHEIEEVHIVGRSPAVQAKFDTVMIRELSKLQDVHFVVSPDSVLGDATDPTQFAKLEAILDLTAVERPKTGRRIVFHFGWTPKSIKTSGDDTVILDVSESRGTAVKTIEGSSLITAVGFQESANSSLERCSIAGPAVELENGVLDKNLFCAGWYRRGPTGTIPENRNDAKKVAEHIVSSWSENGSPKKGLPSIAQFLTNTVSYQGWQSIDREELAAAPEGRQRRKIRDIATMLKTAQEKNSGDQS
ncbi:FAD-dependent oxidoreductase [Pseudomonas sp. CES]|uniref:FAD-dependent oxidoreductase n=1 Tax=Pseudomonas sp. CES TaxID=2719586 RepID=UPI0014700E56|nr:FAD-dependent oxidoreductase [Pseudomonas sp. CES]KAF4558724.1 pyridine nucleotide-disulfide oxidoreductase [Pseudomonas sp. CES]